MTFTILFIVHFLSVQFSDIKFFTMLHNHHCYPSLELFHFLKLKLGPIQQ